MPSSNDKDRLMIVIVIVILALTLWLVRCSVMVHHDYETTDSCVVAMPDTLPDTTFNHRIKKEKPQKQQHRPVERNFLDEKLSD